NFRLRNVCRVSSVKEQKRFMRTRILNPARQLFPRCNCARGIVRKTKINKIGMFLGRLRNEIIFRSAWQINDLFVTAVLARWSGVPKCFAFPGFVDRALSRLGSCGPEPLGYVPNSATNQSFGWFRIGFTKLADVSRDLGKQISPLELEIIFV